MVQQCAVLKLQYTMYWLCLVSNSISVAASEVCIVVQTGKYYLKIELTTVVA